MPSFPLCSSSSVFPDMDREMKEAAYISEPSGSTYRLHGIFRSLVNILFFGFLLRSVLVKITLLIVLWGWNQREKQISGDLEMCVNTYWAGVHSNSWWGNWQIRHRAAVQMWEMSREKRTKGWEGASERWLPARGRCEKSKCKCPKQSTGRQDTRPRLSRLGRRARWPETPGGAVQSLCSSAQLTFGCCWVLGTHGVSNHTAMNRNTELQGEICLVGEQEGMWRQRSHGTESS